MARPIQSEPARGSSYWLLAVALALPTVVTWLYFVALADQASMWQQAAYAVGKGVQFALPVVWVWLVLRERFAITRPGLKGVLVGVAFGLAVMAAMAGLYYGWLKPLGHFDEPMRIAREKVASFGIKTAMAYVALATFYSLGHSLLEEYYWRWFVFGHCCRRLQPVAAIVVSSVGFAAHHVVVVGTYFGYGSLLTWLFTAGIVIGGGVWAVLYKRSGSLVGPWLSHALVDATIFVIGWDLVRLPMA